MDGQEAKVVGSERTLKLENTEKRDTLIADEIRFQDAWAKAKLFEQDAPLPADPQPDKLFTTMAYPYMNGSLHAGHCFTFSKVEFMTGFARMEGRRALLPQGFHCTGMPIKAAADKLAREVEMFGQSFENADVEEVLALRPAPGAAAAAPPAGVAAKTDMSKFSSNKSKAVAKTGKAKYQFQIMLSLGFPIEEIHKFTDPEHWLQVFPERCETDLRRMGARVDWRRSFVTTPANPYYDAFVRWQITRLRELGKIKFGKRYTVYSPKDGQACLDHDRSSGEGITVQEYVAIKMKALQWSDKAKGIIGDKLPADASVYFIPATLRPETMYGQICCFVGPTVAYGIFKAAAPGKDGKAEYYLCTERAARNMAYQNVLAWGQFESVVQLLGADVVGTLVSAPLSVYEQVYILPMQTLKPTKGTGVVACVPSDSPDDYATVTELRRKPEYYQVQPAWLDKDILPIIQTPSSNLIAKHLVEALKINSPKDAKLLEQAKEQAYKEGFYQGTMLIGAHKGAPVQDAKPLIRKQLIDAGDAFNYAEPDGEVISRSADVCVAAYLDQWYLNYGTAENGGDGAWCSQVLEALEDGTVNCFYPEAKHAFEQTLNWLGHWACSRSYGLGTKLPWDHSQLVESLSDSTVYMAYYTVCQYLHGDIFGKTPGKASQPIAAAQMTDDVWDYVFCRTDTVPAGCTIAAADLEGMRREFAYFYPLDARISGKDLINNHLTFCMYHHAALFPKKYWPRGMRVNGHLLVNGQKMSKSTGNFLTLREATEKFGADATRVALADAGDGIEDANFEETVANATILRLYELRKWAQETLADTGLRTGELRLFDKMFDNEMNTLVIETKKNYQGTLFKLALKSGFYDFVASRDWYRDITKASGDGMHHSLVKRYIELQALLLTPIAPHFSEYLWRDVLEHDDSIQNALYPTVPAPNPSLSAARNYIRNTSSSITAAEGQQAKKLAKGKAVAFDPKQPKKLTIFAAQAFPAWQDKCIEVVKQVLEATGSIDVKAVSGKLDKAELKKSMPFIQNIKKRIDSGEDAAAVFDRKLSYDELATLEAMVPGLKQTVNKLTGVTIVSVTPGATSGTVYNCEGQTLDPLPQPAAAATPGSPTFFFENA